jgi:hypothetical protein
MANWKQMTVEEQFAEIRMMLKTLAVTTVAHDNQIEALIKIAERHEAQLAVLQEESRNVQRQWQAYLNTLPKQ